MDQDSQRQMARMMVMEQVFEHEGWREIVAELDNEIEVIKGQLLTADSWEDVKFLQGKADQCMRMIYMADAVANMADLLKEEPEDADV
jgi:glycogen synthase